MMDWRSLLRYDLRQLAPGWRPFPVQADAATMTSLESYPKSIRKKIADPMWRGPALVWSEDVLFVLEQVRLSSRCGLPIHQGLEAAARNEFETLRGCGPGNRTRTLVTFLFAAVACVVLLYAVFYATSGLSAGIPFAFMAAGSVVSWIAGISQGRMRRAAVCGSLIQSMNMGLTLSESMARLDHFFPKGVVSMVAAGESTNRLAQTVEQLNRDAIQRFLGAKQFIGWMVYIGALLLGNIAVIGFLVYKVVPVLLEIMEEIRPLEDADRVTHSAQGGPVLPPLPSLETLGAAPAWMQANLVLLGVLVATFLIIVGSKSIARKSHWNWLSGQGLDLYVPVFRTMLSLQNVGGGAGMLGQLVGAGIPLDRALQTVSESDLHPAYAAWFRVIGDRVRNGESLSDACVNAPARAPVPPSFRDAVAMGEHLNRLEESLAQASERYLADAHTRIQWWIEVVQAASILLLGYFVLSMEVGVFSVLVELADGLMR